MFAHCERHSGSFEEAGCRSRRRVRRASAPAGLRAVGLAALAAGLLAAVPATASAVPGGATVFVHSAKGGEVGGGGRLVLAGVSGRVSWATNGGRSGVISVRRLHRRLIRPGKPATGILHIAGQRGGQELAFRLSRPRYNAARHTVAYRAKPVAKRRAARAAGFRRPRRFGAASLSIIPHPTLMGTSAQGGATCTATIINNTNYELNALGGEFHRLVTDQWNPMWPNSIAAGKSATGTSDGEVNFAGCLNDGIYRAAGTQINVEFTVCIPSGDPTCSGSNLNSCTIVLTPRSGPPPVQFSCKAVSPAAGIMVATVEQG